MFIFGKLLFVCKKRPCESRALISLVSREIVVPSTSFCTLVIFNSAV